MSTTGGRRLVLLSKPSCVGRSPLAKALRRFHPDLSAKLQPSVLYDSSSPRLGERGGEGYADTQRSARPGHLCAALVLALLAVVGETGAEDYTAARHDMLRTIEQLTAETALDTGRPRVGPRVLSALGKVERHLFVPPAQQRDAYENRPLPIGHGQTISQPYLVALMTDLAQVRPDDTVLEIGTGSGYQAAVLGELAKSVYTIEIVEPLGKSAEERLGRLGYRNVEVKVADGYYGWPEHGPFDAILVTAASSHVPPPLVKQLKPGGRMVIPVGTAFLTQHLMLIEKQDDGSVVNRQILPVSFVPLTGGH